MTQIPGYPDAKNVLVIGLGITGKAYIQYLSQFDVTVVVTDTRLGKQQQEDKLSAYGKVSCWDRASLPLESIDLIAVSPGVPLRDSLVGEASDLGIPCVSDVALFKEAISSPMIAVTGSNGKTTVTSLVTALLQGAGYQATACGNIGVPVLNLLNNEEKTDYYVCELSSAQLARTPSLQAKVAVCLNITDNHLDWHGTMEHYIASKKSVYEACDFAVYPVGEKCQGGRKQFSFSAHLPADVWVNKGYYEVQGKQLLAVNELHLTAAHEQENVCAALACVLACGVDMSTILPALKAFRGLPHRCQKIAVHEGVAWFNDSKATNVAATQAGMLVASEGLPGQLIMIMGGLSKGADLSPLRELMAKKVKHVFVIGKDAYRFEEALSPVVSLSCVSTLEEAVFQAGSLAITGDAVLLGTACDSRDMFLNYEQRGELFCQYVDQFIKGNES